MLLILKLMLFFVIGGGVCILGFMAYRYFNEKINSSRTLPALLLNAFLLIAINITIFLGGLLALFKVYEMLSDV
jgi:hypothetical protein